MAVGHPISGIYRVERQRYPVKLSERPGYRRTDHRAETISRGAPGDA